MIVALCIPSRGLVHSRTMEACLLNLKRAEVDWIPCFTHDKPIPEAQNVVTAQALESKAEWLWYLEEDMIPPADALRAMLPEAKVTTARYRNRGGTWAYSLDEHGRVRYAGMGCLLVHRSVFSALESPYFQTAYNWNWVGEEGRVKASAIEENAYGRQDVHFFAQLWQAGIEARLANIVCEHASVRRYGVPKQNQGCHDIEII